MNKLLLTCGATALFASSSITAAQAEEVKIGLLLGYTGPVESMMVAISAGGELAIKEVSDSGLFLNGSTAIAVKADSTCVDNAAATAAAERLITSDGVKAILGADCSGVTGAVLTNVALPNGIVMISPSATSPGLSEAEDNGLFFRTAPSGAREGQVMSEILMEQGVKSVAVTYTNNDYGKGLADTFEASFTAMGGEITISASHEDGKADYSAEIGALSAAGGDRLVVVGYVDEGGSGILQAALDVDAFDMFHLPAGMMGEALETNFGTALDGSSGQHPGTDSSGAATYVELVGDAFDASSSFSAESYDAAALILLSMQAAGSSDSNTFKSKVMDVANAPGVKIYPGELAKALKILADGGEIDYVGASAVEFIGGGESAGNYRQVVIKDGKMTTVTYR